MKKIIFTVSLLFAAIALVTAQSYKGSGGAFSIGVQSMNSENLPAVSNIAPDFDAVAFNFGGYMYWQLQRFTLGLKGYGVGTRPVEEGNYRYNLVGGAFLGEIGYKVVYKKKHAIYPFAGIGYGGLRYEIDDTRNVELTGDPQGPLLNSGSYNMGTLVYDIGIRWEAFLFYDEKEPEAGFLGLEAGYQFATPSRDWNTRGGGNLSGIEEEYNFDGWFLKLTIGGFEGFFE